MKNLTFVLVGCVLFSAGAGCGSSTRSGPAVVYPVAAAFADTINGRPTGFYTLKNSQGIQAAFTSYGARLVSLIVPDKEGKPVSVVVGFDSVAQYQRSTEPYFGATIGRYGNRIRNGQFSLEGKRYSLPVNNGANTLHGGKSGFQDRIWNAVQTSDSSLQFMYEAKEGEEGFPGNLQTNVTYTLQSDKSLCVTYTATTDQPTVVNLTNHAFFNLNGEGSGPVLDHDLWINADSYTPVDSTLIPVGRIETVKGTPFDFTRRASIGKRINADNVQLTFGKGFDHNFVLNGSGMRKIAAAAGDRSGIIMEVWTTEPGLQFYSGNFMQGKNRLRGGVRDDFRTAFCLETQHFPDSPNQPVFPSTVLRPGEVYRSATTYKFSVAPPGL